MKINQAAVLEPRRPERERIIAGLRKAGIKVTSACSAQELRKERLVVVGPSHPAQGRVGREVRAALPQALVLAGMRRPRKAAWADGVLPLPISGPDLLVRLPELLRLRNLKEAPVPRPGEGILDPRTGFYTFAHFKEVLFVEVKRARRYNFPLSLAIIGFDPLPRPSPPELEDKLFSGLALAIRRSLRDTDFAVQYSPNRVVLLMPHTDLKGAMVVSGRICERVARATLRHGDEEVRPTISIGVSAAATPAKELSFADLVKQAQGAMEQAAAAGGSRVELGVGAPAS